MTSDQVLARLQRQCSRMEYCSRDIYRKALKALEGDAEAAERIVASLRADRFVDDLRYASAFAREKASLQGWGPVKISFQLRGKGIPEETVRAALAENGGTADFRRETPPPKPTIRTLSPRSISSCCDASVRATGIHEDEVFPCLSRCRNTFSRSTPMRFIALSTIL